MIANIDIFYRYTKFILYIYTHSYHREITFFIVTFWTPVVTIVYIFITMSVKHQRSENYVFQRLMSNTKMISLHKLSVGKNVGWVDYVPVSTHISNICKHDNRLWILLKIWQLFVVCQKNY